MNAPLELLAAESRDVDVRHHTIRTVISWSYDLLISEDRATLLYSQRERTCARELDSERQPLQPLHNTLDNRS